MKAIIQQSTRRVMPRRLQGKVHAFENLLGIVFESTAFKDF